MMTESRLPRPAAPVVLVVDDDASMRAALADLLASVGLMAQLYGSVQELLDGSRPDAPTCLVLDIRMPGISGLDFQRQMAKANLRMPVVFITGHGDVPMAVRAMKEGAVEFLGKPFRNQDLLDAIQVGLDRDRERRRRAAALEALRRRFNALSRGERDVMALVVRGRLNKQIAATLAVSEITVKVRRAQLMRKMEAASLPDLVRMADLLDESAAAG